MANRRIYIDESPGETRGVITLDGRPERLLLRRAGNDYPRLGARYIGRVLKIERGSDLALIDLGADGHAALRLKPDRPVPVEGQALDVEISIEPQGPKAAVVRVIGPASGHPGICGDPMTLEARLRAFAPEADIVSGLEARLVADQAEDEALAVEHPLPNKGSLAIEGTRALTAVDVDLGSGGGRDPKRAAREANMTAIAEAARLLRLRSVGGLVVIDLVGRGHDGAALTRAVQTAFARRSPNSAPWSWLCRDGGVRCATACSTPAVRCCWKLWRCGSSAALSARAGRILGGGSWRDALPKWPLRFRLIPPPWRAPWARGSKLLETGLCRGMRSK